MDQVERECMEQFEAERADDGSFGPEKLEKVRLMEKKFEEEVAKYKQTLVTSRDAIWDKNQRDLDAQVEKLEREKVPHALHTTHAFHTLTSTLSGANVQMNAAI